MLKNKLKAVGRRFKNQANKLFRGTEPRNKKIVMERYITTVCTAFPEIPREDIAIIITGFIAELRSLEHALREQIIRGE